MWACLRRPHELATMKRIPLTQGKAAFVSDRDWSLVRQFRWHAHHSRSRRMWYARASIPNGRRGPPKILMHVLILGRRGDVDHHDHNGLNNQRRNLRRASRSANLANRGKTCRNKSGYKGVCWNKEKGVWQAQIKWLGVHYNLGKFSNKRIAATVYAKAARRLHRRFARTQNRWDTNT